MKGLIKKNIKRRMYKKTRRINMKGGRNNMSLNNHVSNQFRSPISDSNSYQRIIKKLNEKNQISQTQTQQHTFSKNNRDKMRERIRSKMLSM